MSTVILDCYTDEPSGLGVPPYLGTYPRYLAGKLELEGEPWDYITIDDLRAFRKGRLGPQFPRPSQKTDIFIYNQTNQDIAAILSRCSRLIVNLGVHAPGKYLSAMPGTLHEIIPLIQDLHCEKILTGPAVFGTSLQGGRMFEKADLSLFSKIEPFKFRFDEIRSISLAGAVLLKKIPDLRIVEIETGRGCSRAIGCSFCTEPIKSRFEARDPKDVVDEVKALYELGQRYFRLGKQACFFSIPKGIEILEGIHKECPKIEVLHIDNVDPIMVNTPRGLRTAEAVVKYCTPGNIAAFGVESFDPVVIEQNHLNSTPERTYEAIKTINRIGAKRGANGVPSFLPGINILFGLMGETKATHDHNMHWLKKIIADGLLLRRINIRQVAVFEGTDLHERAGTRFLKKNRSHYFRWRNDIRQHIDLPNLERAFPIGSILHNVRTEIYDGNTTFARQVGTYPLVIGIKGRMPLGRFISVEVSGHMLRSIVGRLVSGPPAMEQSIVMQSPVSAVS